MTWLEWIAIAALAGLAVWAATGDRRWAALAAAVPIVGRLLFVRNSKTENNDEEPYDDPPDDDVEDVPSTDDDRPIDDYVEDVHSRTTEGD